MRIRQAIFKQDGWLENAFLLCWYLTIGSAAFGDCLLRVTLPIGGHFFLFRGAILLTCLLYGILLIKRRENPLNGLSHPEKMFVLLMATMLVYGVISVAWAISIGAWFSKFFTMCQMFALSFIFLKICRDPKIMRVTMALIGITVLICAVGGFIECFTGPFFDTPYRDYAYVFFNKGMYAPIFTFYNPNGMAVYLLFSIETLYLWLAWRWKDRSERTNKIILWFISGGLGFSLFLCCADGGRLAIMSIPIILCGVALWLFFLYRKGLRVFILFFACFVFIYVGENYNQVKYYIQETGEQIQQFFVTDEPGTSEDVPSGETSSGGALSGGASSGEKPPENNGHGTLNTIIPSITGEHVNESIAASDGVRVTLLKNSLDMLIKSKGMGVGLGNVEFLMKEYGNTYGLLNVHCFIMEVMVEFGVFALIPFLLVIFASAKSLLEKFIVGVKLRDRHVIAKVLLLLFTAIAYPLLSTANSSSWGIVAMWIYIALILLYSGMDEQKIPEVN